jgi:hypothetical protein
MFIVRDVFNCKPGKAKDLAEKFTKAIASMPKDDRFRNPRVMVDAVAEYWTVVLEAEVETLADFEQNMRDFGNRAEVREALAGYMDLVNGGRREIYRIV